MGWGSRVREWQWGTTTQTRTGGRQGNVLEWVGWRMKEWREGRHWKILDLLGCWGVCQGEQGLFGGEAAASWLPHCPVQGQHAHYGFCSVRLELCNTVVLGRGSRSPRTGCLTSARDACPIDGHLTHCTDWWFLPENLLPEAMWLGFPRLGRGGGAETQTGASVPSGPIWRLGQRLPTALVPFFLHPD